MFMRWGRTLYTHRKLVLLLAALGLIASIASIVTFGATLSDEGFFNEESESALVDERIAREFGRGSDQIVFLFDAPGPVSDPARRSAVEEALTPLTPERGVIRVLTAWNTGNPGFISEDGQSTYAVALLTDAGVEEAEALQEAVTARAEAAGLEAGITGGPAIGEAIVGSIEEGLFRAELVSIPLTILIQLVVFGGLLAAGVPLLIAMLAIVGAIAVIFGLSGTLEQSVFAINIITMLGLGLGIDYSLFMVARFREELRQRPVAEATAVTMATVGKAVLFSGITVILGLAATQFFPLAAVRSMGQAGIAVVALALIYGLTFLPALLATLGTRINAIPVGRRRGGVEGAEGGFWRRIAAGVMRRPVAVFLPVLVLLLAAGIPFLRLDLTPGGPEVLPADSEARIVDERIRAEFPADESNPVPLVLVAEDSDPLSAASLQAQQTLVSEIAALPNVDRVDSLVSGGAVGAFDAAAYRGDPATLPAEVQTVAGQTVQGDAVLIEVLTRASGAPAEDLVKELRALDVAGIEQNVGGFTAIEVDTVADIQSALIPALLFVLVSSYLVLLLTFGSVFLPLKAILMTLLSITASLGALVLVFQDGNLSGLLGFTATGEIVSTTPILMFCILFGLSMDYEVLMLSRIQEEYLRTGDNVASVAFGLERTAKTITGAAAIMIVVFGGFMLAEIVIIKSMGFGLALAVLIDATIVRGLLVPSTMRLMGRWNWWAPAPVRSLVDRLGFGHTEVSPRGAGD